MPTPAEPPTQLRGFPTTRLPLGQVLYRIVRRRDADGRVRTPWFFASSGRPDSGRFDLPVPDGTCSLSDRAYGAWLEVFGQTRIVARADAASRALFTVTRVGTRLTLADFGHERAATYGVTLDLSAGDDRPTSQRWARAIRAHGLAGIVAWIRHDPTATARNVALFGPSGARSIVRGWRSRTTDVLAATELRGQLARFGIAVLDVPYDVAIAPLP